VHALLGQNGAGKSTFVKILAGYHSADEGSQISVWGEQAHLTTTNGPRLGIGIVHQDLPFADGLSFRRPSVAPDQLARRGAGGPPAA
jgi:ABC-type sugar transport system ATPase subunit